MQQTQHATAIRTPALEKVAQGQRLAVIGVALLLGNLALHYIAPPVAAFASLGIGALICTAVWMIGEGLGYSVLARVGLIVLAFVPLVSILMVLVVNSRATAALRAGGYGIGFLGARR